MAALQKRRGMPWRRKARRSKQKITASVFGGKNWAAGTLQLASSPSRARPNGVGDERTHGVSAAAQQAAQNLAADLEVPDCMELFVEMVVLKPT